MRLSIASEEWESAIDGVLWIVREGEWPKVCPHADPTECSGEHCDCPLAPPAEFVEATKPCSTCRGTRKAYPEHLRGGTALDVVPGYDPRVPCLACRIDLVGDCREDGHPDGYECPPECDQAPILGSAYPASGVLPIVGGSTLRPATAIRVVEWYGPIAPLLIEGNHDPKVTDLTDRLAHYGDPSTLIGQFALRLEVTS